jgi:hypothetical protein
VVKNAAATIFIFHFLGSTLPRFAVPCQSGLRRFFPCSLALAPRSTSNVQLSSLRMDNAVTFHGHGERQYVPIHFPEFIANSSTIQCLVWSAKQMAHYPENPLIDD